MRLTVILVLIMTTFLPGSKVKVSSEPAPVVTVNQQRDVSLIPQPLYLKQEHKKYFTLDGKTKIYADPKSEDLQPLAQLLAQEINTKTNLQLQVITALLKMHQTAYISLFQAQLTR